VPTAGMGAGVPAPRPSFPPMSPSRRDLLVACIALVAALGVAASALAEWPRWLYAPRRPAGPGTPVGAGAPGAGAAPLPWSSPLPEARLVFSESEAAPARTPAALPTDLPTVVCHYRLPALPAGEQLTVTWSCAGKALKPPAAGPKAGARRGSFALTPPGGTFAQGIYVVRVAAGERVLAEGSFLMHPAARRFAGVAAAPQASALVTRSIEFCSRLTDRGEPQDPRLVFPPETRQVYVVFEYAGLEKPTGMVVSWLGDGRPIKGVTTPVQAPPPGGRVSASLEAGEGEALPEGEYTAVLSAAEDQREIARARFAVHAGRAGATPADRPPAVPGGPPLDPARGR